MNLPYAYGHPPVTGTLRSIPEDFVVDEDLGFELTGAGEHVLLHIRKRETNTDWVAQQLIRLTGVPPVDVSYAGLKDRHAVTTQWFSVRMANRPEPDWGELESDSVRIIERVRHDRKLRRGALSGNRFRLVIRNLAGDTDALEQRLGEIGRRGVPNYFGEQRFGRDDGNLVRAEALFTGKLRERNRNKRGLYLSAARSHLFNAVLTQRVVANSWDRALEGEALNLDGRHAWFIAETIDAEIGRRLAERDLHPTGPLWGRGEPVPRGTALALETEALADFDLFRTGLEMAGLKQERRPLRLIPKELTWRIEANHLELAFWLPAGAYATTVVRELVAT